MRPAALCQTTRLSPGQCLYATVAAGTVLHVSEGRVRIDEAPRWLAERCVPFGRPLVAGEHHVVAQSGWIAVTALGAGQGACLHPGPAPQVPARRPVWRFVRRLAGL